ncbi:GntR family transcriptional regulator [Agrococcus carbonis]|uniref:DNA-binding transcriptional regulator, GntR family n=1 Tax=Agrococcus carbonis TaxID=684552 RepID=A0A1H1RL66_9MICO|nr:GntR family transcriptional regulator [Agrococcus carbonis]SDS36537.1 DNA-binding transcriptional regulator, GntR family [Agrococcus carbonis]
MDAAGRGRREGRSVAYDRIRAGIVDRSLAPGSVLSAPELADQLGMSRTPVREALATLTAEGLAVKLPSNRTIVAPVSLEELEHVYDVRARLEGLIAADAAKRVTPADEQILLRQVSLMDRLRDDYLEVVRIGAAFHDHLREMSGNELAASLLHIVRAHVDRYRELTTEQPGRSGHAADEHRAVCEAVLSGDADLAERVMRDHIEHARAVAISLARPVVEG